MKRIFLTLVFLQFFILPLTSQMVSDGVKSAFLEFENINMDPSLDYLGGIIKGLLLYDISRSEYIHLVNRSELERVLDEQSLRLSGLADDSENTLKLGRMLGADWLIYGEYIYLGRDVLITVSLTNVETTRTFVYSDRGSSENTIHGLAEKIVMKLTGVEMVFQNENSVRSIISMRDESPGKVKLYSWVPGAEIYLDEEFIGYTAEDNKVPYIIEKVEPGEHKIRTHYWPFGEVDLPEVVFHDWDEEFEIASGEEVVIRANQRQFNSIIYDLQQLIRENYRFTTESEPLYEKTHKTVWLDREALKHEIEYSIKALYKEDSFTCDLSLNYDGVSYVWALETRENESLDLNELVNDVEVRFSYSRGRIDYSIWRQDIEQGMWQN